jgi:hypothetical protein
MQYYEVLAETSLELGFERPFLKLAQLLTGHDQLDFVKAPALQSDESENEQNTLPAREAFKNAEIELHDAVLELEYVNCKLLQQAQDTLRIIHSNSLIGITLEHS